MSILSDCNKTIIYDLQHKEDYLYAFKNRHGHTLKIDPLDSIVEERWGITGEEIYDTANKAAFKQKCYNTTEEGGSYKSWFLAFRHFARKAVKFKKRLPQIHAEMEKRHVRIKWHYNDKDDRNHSDFYRYDKLECFRECKFCRTPEIYEGEEDDDVDDDDDDYDDDDDAAASSSGGGFMKNDFDAKSSAEARSKTANGNGKDDDDDDIGDGSRGGISYFLNEEDDEEAEWACSDAYDEDDRDKKRQRKNGDNATHDKNEKQQRKRQRDNGGDADHDDSGNRN